MYLDFGAKEIPSGAIRALGSTMGSGGFIGATQQQVNSYRSEWEKWDEECGGRACPAIAPPYNCPEGSTIRFTGAPPTGGCCDYPAYTCDSASYYPQTTEPSGGGSPQSDSNIPTPCKPVYGSTNPYADNMNEIIGYDCSGSGSSNPQVTLPYVPSIGEPIYVPQKSWDQAEFRLDGSRCGGNMRPYIPCNPNSTCYYEDVCAPLSDGQGICTPNSQIPADYEDRMANRDCSVKYFQDEPEMLPDDVTDFQDEPEMLPDDVTDFDTSSNPCAGVRCIKVYKPCPEGYIDVSECCPNTGDCAPDPDYVIPNVGLVQMQPIGETAPVNFVADPATYRSVEYGTLPDDTCGSGGYWGCPTTPVTSPISSDGEEFQLDGVAAVLGLNEMNQPVRSSTPLPFERTTTAPTTPTTATPTPEEPKQGGLGILVLGLIALEALAT